MVVSFMHRRVRNKLTILALVKLTEKKYLQNDFLLKLSILGEASIRSISVIISKETTVGNSNIKYKKITVSYVKSLILSGRGMRDYPLNKLNLWKLDRVSVDKNDKLLETFSTENDIEEKLGGELMHPRHLLGKYFNENSFKDKESKSAIHIIVQFPTFTTDYSNKRPRLDFNNIPLDLGRSPTPLLYTDGFSWDYQESHKLEEELRRVQRNRRDKTNTPIFFMVTGAGCGKSRNATEIPNILRKIFVNDLELRSRLEDALTFAITFENGTKINLSTETSISKRMLYQLQDQLLWNEIRDDTQILSITDVLKRSTLARPFHQVVADSHQKGDFLPIRSLDPPKREGCLIFKYTPLLNMLINDMGGNGRALEALATALKDVDIENDSFVSIAEKVYYQLKDHYNEWISHIHYLAPVLRVILTRTTLAESIPIPGTNILPEDLSRLGLIKFEKQDESSSEGTLTCPYIWLWLMENVSKSDSILRHWNFKYYNEIQANDGDPTIPPGCQFWQHFEHFIASFRVLKSKVFETDKEIKLQDIHAGAKHNFGTATIRNIPLSLAKATRQQSTKSSAYSANKMVTYKRGDAQINLDLEGASACIINGSSAPAGDSFCPIYFANSFKFHIESNQCKCLKSTTVNQKTFDEEHEKACDKDDVFYTLYLAFLLVQNKPFNVNNAKPSELTPVTGIGPIRAKLLIQERQERPFDNLEDCFNRTRISRKDYVSIDSKEKINMLGIM
ncbi:hypothetical protein C1646_763981 [Rhizophagus diaphanus]|nr:hypothetical protein C1646_763981 [Rhizophagus diaphanus] [Rhizophagus sp. MUCL 43196]